MYDKVAFVFFSLILYLQEVDARVSYHIFCGIDILCLLMFVFPVFISDFVRRDTVQPCGERDAAPFEFADILESFHKNLGSEVLRIGETGGPTQQIIKYRRIV